MLKFLILLALCPLLAAFVVAAVLAFALLYPCVLIASALLHALGRLLPEPPSPL